MIKIVSSKYPDLLVQLESASIQFESGEAVLDDQKAEKEFLDFVKRSKFLGLEIAETSSDQEPEEQSKKAENTSKKAEEPSKKDKNSPETDSENLV